MYGQRSRFRPSPLVIALIALGTTCRLALDAHAHVGARTRGGLDDRHQPSHVGLDDDGTRDDMRSARDDPQPVPTGAVGSDTITDLDAGDGAEPLGGDEHVETDALGLKPKHAPAVAEVIAAAYRAAGLDRDLTRPLARRARVAGLVPWLTVRVGRDTNWATDDPAIDRRMAFEVRGTWRLDRLVFDARELQVATIEAARRRERRILSSRVIRAYFAWRRAVARAGAHIATRSQSLQAAAELDALTDGWFSETLAGKRRTASENRTR